MPTEAQLRDVALCARICRLVDEGGLPVVLPDTINAGYGSGAKCHACDEPVIRSQIEYDVGHPKDNTVLLRLHMGCYVLWQIECVKRIRNQRQADTTDLLTQESSVQDSSAAGTLLH